MCIILLPEAIVEVVGCKIWRAATTRKCQIYIILYVLLCFDDALYIRRRPLNCTQCVHIIVPYTRNNNNNNIIFYITIRRASSA